MLPRVAIGRHLSATFANLENYRYIVGDELIDELLSLAKDLNGVRICHLNSTSSGGGVAELLSRELPLVESLGIDAEWRLIHGTPEFFTVTKALHNGLQGAHKELTDADRKAYLEVNERAATLLDTPYDVIVAHDPQPAAVRHFAGQLGAKWIWRCHVDSSTPDEEHAKFAIQFIDEYDAVIFTMPEFLLPGLRIEHAAFIAPAIDPLSTKNLDMPCHLCREVVADHGVDVNRPLLVQVSRFDPWKDPLGVIEAYRLVKRELPPVQLALIGAMAGDDPEGWELLDEVEEVAAGDNDLFVFTNLGGVGNMEVNVFQRACDVVIQKSLREGFGLVVSEAFWKEKPVVAGKAGGIPMQFPEGAERYLVDDVEGCAEQALHLLNHVGERGQFGRAGRDHVRKHFLLPRLVRDELKLIKDVLDGTRSK